MNNLHHNVYVQPTKEQAMAYVAEMLFGYITTYNSLIDYTQWKDKREIFNLTKAEYDLAQSVACKKFFKETTEMFHKLSIREKIED